MRSAYSPTIQIMAARASGSSNESRFSHRVAITLSYLQIVTWKKTLRDMNCNKWVRNYRLKKKKTFTTIFLHWNNLLLLKLPGEKRKKIIFKKCRLMDYQPPHVKLLKSSVKQTSIFQHKLHFTAYTNISITCRVVFSRNLVNANVFTPLESMTRAFYARC